MNARHLLIATAAAEAGTGLLLLLLPAVPLKLLLGIVLPGADVALVSRVAGAALLAIGISCWLARSDANGAAQRPLLIGVLIYDAIVAVVLVYAGWVLSLAGIALWPAVGIHAALAVWCLAVLRRPANQRYPQCLRRPDEGQSRFRNAPDYCFTPGAHRCTGVRSADRRDLRRRGRTRTSVDDSYSPPFRFTGTIDKLTFKLGPSQLAADDQRKLQEALARARDLGRTNVHASIPHARAEVSV